MIFRHGGGDPAAVFRRLAGAALVLVGLGGCAEGAEYRRYAGETMGTYYQVTARCPRDVGDVIAGELRAVNEQMSTYLSDSALSRFNRAPVDTWFPVPAPLAGVVAAALTLSRESAGAFDVTVGPLVNLWGFGPAEVEGVPSAEAVGATRERVGHELLEVRRSPPALKKHGDVYVDLSAIAKGHGVDRVSTRLAEAGCDATLVDVGGEVKGRGPGPGGRPWRIGVEVPDPASQGAIQRVVALVDGAIATSGDYRNFIEADGQRYSHTLDPRTGYPVAHGLASVSVLHASAMWADGYATLLTVLGPDHGLAFAREHDLAALLVARGENRFEERYTDAFEAALIN